MTGAGRGSVVTLRGVELRGRRVGLDLRLLGSQAVQRFLRAVLLVGPHSVLLVGGGILAVASDRLGSATGVASLVTIGPSVRREFQRVVLRPVWCRVLVRDLSL